MPKISAIFLPDVVAMSTASDNRLAKTLQPVLDRSIHESVKKNPKVLADAIFPVLGPGNQKSHIIHYFRDDSDA